ncbi:MAG TPA: VanZ family protein [Chitinophagaceae bacterium]|nr:VanZ family protein [Chitinophagaceae bacterium]
MENMKSAIERELESRTVRWVAWSLLLMCGMILVRYILVKGGPDNFKRHFEEVNGMQLLTSGFKRANFIPFASFVYFYEVRYRFGYVLKNVIGNVAGFVPLGVLLPVLFPSLRTASRTIGTVFLISLGFETLQLVFNLGVFDVDDLLLNTVGGSIGYLVFRVGLRLAANL